MDGLLQQGLDFSKNVVGKINPYLGKLSGWIGDAINVSSKNVQTFIVLGGAIYLGYIINGRELGIKGLIYGGLIFLLFRYLGGV